MTIRIRIQAAMRLYADIKRADDALGELIAGVDIQIEDGLIDKEKSDAFALLCEMQAVVRDWYKITDKALDELDKI